MNEMDTREGKEGIAGNAVVGAVLLALLPIFSLSPPILSFPSLPCSGGLVVQFSFKEGNRWLA